jgi:hypothetical protein
MTTSAAIRSYTTPRDTTLRFVSERLLRLTTVDEMAPKLTTPVGAFDNWMREQRNAPMVLQTLRSSSVVWQIGAFTALTLNPPDLRRPFCHALE